MSSSAFSSLLSVPLFSADQRRWSGTQVDHWTWHTFTGRLSEFSGNGASAVLTLACRVVYEAQLHGEPVAWVTREASCFFPPDVAENGIDLEALVVVRVPDSRAVARAADLLLRSGGFGLLVLDLGKDAQLPLPLQTRLVGLARVHTAAVLLLTQKPSMSPSVSSLVALHGDVARRHIAPDQFACTLSVVKDKRWGPSWTHVEVAHGPSGVR
ncbi:MAG: recombinase A [Candidatus Binatia bacterium]